VGTAHKQLELGMKRKELEAKGLVPPEDTLLGFEDTSGELPTGLQVHAGEAEQTHQELTAYTLGAEKGLLNHLVGPMKAAEFRPLITKVQLLAAGEKGVDGKPVHFTREDQQRLAELNTQLGSKIALPLTRADAFAALSGLSVSVVQKVRHLSNPSSKKAWQSQAAVGSVHGALAAVDRLGKALDRNATQGRLYAEEVLDAQERIRPGYEGAVIYGRDRQGRPLVDVSGVAGGKRDNLLRRTNAYYTSRDLPLARVYTMGTDAAMVHTALNKTKVHKVVVDGKDVTAEFKDTGRLGELGSMPDKIQNLNLNDIQALFGKETIATFDGAAQTVRLEFRRSGDNKVATKFETMRNKNAVIEITLPFSAVSGQQGVNARLAEKVKENQVDYRGPGLSWRLFQDPGGIVREDPILRDMGFEYTATGSWEEGRYAVTVAFRVRDHETGKPVELPSKTFYNVDPKQHSTLIALDDHVSAMLDEWARDGEMVYQRRAQQKQKQQPQR
jgi:hypothetical protein